MTLRTEFGDTTAQDHRDDHLALHRRYNGAVTPVVVADGETNDTAAVQAAIDAAPAGGVVDLTTSGTILSGTLTISKSLTITMRGGAIAKTANLFVVSGGADVDIIIDGIRNVDASGSKLIYLAAGETVGNLTICDCTTEYGGVLVQGTVAQNLRIQNNEIGRAGAGHYSINVSPVVEPDYVNQCIIEGNIVTGSLDTGEGLIDLGGVADLLIIANNRLRNCASDGGDFDAGSRRAIITGNICENTGGFEIKSGSRWDGKSAEQLICANNVFLNCGTGFSARATGLYIGNVIINDQDTAVRGIYHDDAEGVQILNNYIHISTGYGIQIKASDVMLAGNHIHTGNSNAVLLTTGDRVKIHGNYLETASEATKTVLLQGGDSAEIIGNTIVGGQYSWDTGSATNVTARDNQCSGYADGVGTGTAYAELVLAFTNNDATPSVFGGCNGGTFTCDHDGSTSITNFDDGLDGQQIAVLFTTANATLVDGTNIMLHGSENYNPPAGTMMQFQRIGGVWYEINRRNT